MSFFPNPQTFVSFSIGTLTFDIRWYAMLILTGAFIAYLVMRKNLKETRYFDMDFFDSIFVYTLWAGIIGARIWFCVFYDFKYYFSNPAAIIRVWDGGLAIQGGLVFGALFAYFYCRKKHYSFLMLADNVLPEVLIGQAVGRWGNFVNKECHGAEVNEEYFNGILSFLKEGMYINGHYYEPLFFYESLLCILGFCLIYFVLRRYQNKRGDLAWAYMMWYGVIRFFIEARRTDSLYLGNLKMAQLTSITFLIVGLLGYIGILDRFIKKQKPTLIFDFDGTLVDTRESITETYRHLFRKYSDESKFTDEIRNEIIGPALRDLFPKYFPGVDYDTLYKDYRERQSEVSKTANHPTEHSVELLKSLHEQGYHIGIVSTRSKEGIEGILDTFGLREYVDDICGLKEVTNLKPDPEGIFYLVNRNNWEHDTVMIGDSLMDIGCGSNYGAYTVAYISDPQREEELKKAANETIVSMDELYGILNKDISFTYNKK